jgi:hypothetical protein
MGAAVFVRAAVIRRGRITPSPSQSTSTSTMTMTSTATATATKAHRSWPDSRVKCTRLRAMLRA